MRASGFEPPTSSLGSGSSGSVTFATANCYGTCPPAGAQLGAGRLSLFVESWHPLASLPGLAWQSCTSWACRWCLVPREFAHAGRTPAHHALRPAVLRTSDAGRSAQRPLELASGGGTCKESSVRLLRLSTASYSTVDSSSSTNTLSRFTGRRRAMVDPKETH